VKTLWLGHQPCSRLDAAWIFVRWPHPLSIKPGNENQLLSLVRHHSFMSLNPGFIIVMLRYAMGVYPIGNSVILACPPTFHKYLTWHLQWTGSFNWVPTCVTHLYGRTWAWPTNTIPSPNFIWSKQIVVESFTNQARPFHALKKIPTLGPWDLFLRSPS